jgi:hypothetical protein
VYTHEARQDISVHKPCSDDPDTDLTQSLRVFCLEGEWEGLQGRLSVRPLLELLESLHGVRTAHRTVATRPELEYHLRRFADRLSEDRSVAYLAFHASSDGLSLVGGDTISLTDLEHILRRGAEGHLLLLGGCEMLARPDDDLKTFCQRTGVRALAGYAADIDWAQSAAFDLLLLDALMKSLNLKPMVARLRREYPGLVDRLGFTMATSSWVER